MGKIVGNYEIHYTLGKGQFGKVKYCTHIKTGDAWAIKIMSKEKISHKGWGDRIKREIAILKMVGHEHVVKMEEVLQTKNNIYIVMELLTNGELFDKIVENKLFSERKAREYYQQLILGLEYCHGLGIAHRDLKPENLILDKHDKLKISDFGLAALVESSNFMLETRCGSPYYVAPDVVNTEKSYNGMKADIWSSGVILFLLVAGYLPFDSDNTTVLFDLIKKGKFQFPGSFSRSLRDLLKKILVVNPDERISIEEIKQHKWFKENLKKTIKYINKIKITDKHLLNAITDSFVENNQTFSDNGGKNSPQLNAFELASGLMMRKISAFTLYKKKKAMNKNFMAKGKRDDIVLAILDVCKAHKIKTELLVKRKRIKCISYSGKSRKLVTFEMLLTKTISEGIVMCEILRARGSKAEFEKVFEKIVNGLKSMVLTNKITRRPFSPDEEDLHVSMIPREKIKN